MWYVVQVATGKEQVAQRVIERHVDGRLYSECFVPKYEVMKKFGGVWQKRRETVFPGYLFVISGNVQELADELARLPVFTRVLASSERFTPLAGDEVALLSAFTEVKRRTIGMSEGVIEGDKVIILKGPLMRQEGLIRKIDRHKRLAYLDIKMFGRTKTIKVGLEIVRKTV